MNFVKTINYLGNSEYECECLECQNHYVTYLDKRSNLNAAYCPECKTFPTNLTQAVLKKFFVYNPITGEFTRRLFSGTCGKIGDVVGTLNNQGYLVLGLNNKTYLLHRLVWLYMYGFLPKEEIDHIDHNRTNNALSNLRLVNSLGNKQNASLSKNNKTGHNGVALHKPTGKYRAYIMINKKQIHLGLFETLQEAIDARKQADISYNFHKNHGK